MVWLAVRMSVPVCSKGKSCYGACAGRSIELLARIMQDQRLDRFSRVGTDLTVAHVVVSG